jgi:hypothetical protein
MQEIMGSTILYGVMGIMRLYTILSMILIFISIAHHLQVILHKTFAMNKNIGDT